MTRVAASGITVEVPVGWEGRIYEKREAGPRPTGTLEHNPNAVLHVASFPLPPGTGDYGGGAVEQMSNTDLLVILLEHGRPSIGTPLFSGTRIPRLTIPCGRILGERVARPPEYFGRLTRAQLSAVPYDRWLSASRCRLRRDALGCQPPEGR